MWADSIGNNFNATECAFQANSATGLAAAGGAIALVMVPTTTLQDCSFEKNSVAALQACSSECCSS